MATSTALGYNTGTTITGTQQIGSLAVVTATTANPSSSPNGVKFWMGPDEESGYVVGIPVALGNQSTPVGINASLGFIRSTGLTESSFLTMVNNTFVQSFTGGTQAATWLNDNGYWTSYSSYLLNSYSGASAAYSLRKLNGNYTGSAIRVERSSDNTQQDIGFSGNSLDTTALTTFVGSSTGKVVVWYDQSGNGRNANKYSTNDLPSIVINGTTQSLNGKPALRFAGSQLIAYTGLTQIMGPTATTISFGVGSVDGTVASTRLMLKIDGQTATNSQTIRQNNASLESIIYNNSTTFSDNTNVSLTAGAQFIACTQIDVSSVEISQNNQTNGATSATGLPDYTGQTGNIFIGVFNATPPGNFTWLGYMQEIIVFGLKPSLNTNYRSNITNAINSYYGTY